MVSVTLSPQGSVLIPANLRRALRLRSGESLLIHLDGEKLVLEKKKQEKQEQAQLIKGYGGRMALKAPPTAPAMTTEMVNAILEEYS